MDALEQGLQRIDAHRQSAVGHHEDLFHKAILDAAHLSQRGGANLDREFSEHFPEIQTYAENMDQAPVFNPTTVVEMRDGKAYQVLEDWDKEAGILPRRTVTGQYHIDFGKELDPGFYLSGVKVADITPSTSFTSSNTLQNTTAFTGVINATSEAYKITSANTYGQSGTNIHAKTAVDATAENFDRTIMVHPNTDVNTRGYERKMFIKFPKMESLDFEVDNYLNLYHRQSGLYLLFNKTGFPGTAFHLYNPLSALRPFFKSKRVQDTGKTYGEIHKAVNLSVQKSKDSRPVFLAAVASLIPEDYTAVYHWYDRFRKFNQFTQILTESAAASCVTSETPVNAPQEALLQSFRIRLQETRQRAESAERRMQSMVDDYDAKTLQNKDLNRQISTLTLTHTECEAQWETARTAHAQELQTARSAHAKELQTVRSAHAQELQTVRSAHAQELRTREAEKQLAQSSEFEDLQAAYFRAQQQLLAVEHAKATESSLNMNVDTLKKENTALRLNQQRIQDRHDVLMTTCADAKAKTRLVQEQLAKIQCEFLNLETLSVQHENTITRFKSELEDKHHEISKLTAALKECGATSGDALENALSEKILHLEETNGRLRHELKTAHSELEDVKRCADATKASLAGVIASIVGVTAKATL
jgi:hypothetical protein